MKWKKYAISIGISSALIFGALGIALELTREKEIVFAGTEANQELETSIGVEDPVYFDENGNLFLPVRELMDAMGGKISWDVEGKQLEAIYQGRVLKTNMRTGEAVVSGYAVTLSVAPQIKDNTLYVAASTLQEIFGMEISWQAEDGKAIVKSGQKGTPAVLHETQRVAIGQYWFDVEIPVVIGLNDVAYEKNLNTAMQKKFATLLEEKEQAQSDFMMALHVGQVDGEVISFYWQGMDEQGTFYDSLNINLREQQEITWDSPEAMVEQKRWFADIDNLDDFIFYFDKKAELVVFGKRNQQLNAEFFSNAE